jgi:High-affinity nickel-transport protein
MFGIDDQIASLGTGESFLIVVAVAILLGLRHATDPDHLTAVSTLVASGNADARGAGRLGLMWGLGHATTLFLFGLPIVFFDSYLPESMQTGAEVVIGIVIVGLAVRLLLRLRRPAQFHSHIDTSRTPLQSYGIGLVHGIGGSAGVGVLLLAAIPDHVEGAVALALFAAFTAVSMAIASTSFGFTLSRDAVLRRFATVAPVLATFSLAFGVWYSLGALDAVPYVL